MRADGRPLTDRRSAGWLPEVVVGIGLVALVVTAVGPWAGDASGPTTAVVQLPGFVMAVVVRRARPDLPISALFLVGQGLTGLYELTEALVADQLADGAAALTLAWSNLLLLELSALSGAVLAYGVAFYPDGRPARRSHATLALAGAALVVLVPVLVSVAAPTVPFEDYLLAPVVDNPLHVGGVRLSPGAAQVGIGLGWALLLTGPLVLAVRYRTGTPDMRRRVRWLLVPLVLLTFVVLANLLLPGNGGVLAGLSLLGVEALLPVAFGLGILDDRHLDVDRVLRQSLVYGVLWLAIAVGYLAIAAFAGVTASRALSVEWAVVTAVVAGMLFQPARSRLEEIADRRVFGRRADASRVVSRLGATLAETVDQEELLSRMAEALEDGLGLEWASVRLRPGDERPDAALRVPIVLDGQALGVVECGPRTRGAPWTPDDRTIVTTFASQAALAVRNVRLTVDLAEQANEIAASRRRLVEAQETERRRIERNIHDGVQQEIVALIGHAGLVQHRLRRRQVATVEELVEEMVEELQALQEGLQRLLDHLRALASGVHPTVLSDHGLVAAVEALTARHPVPVQLRVDPGLVDVRLQEAVEGAAYYVVAESLANSLKHADAGHLAVRLGRVDGHLVTAVTDDGVGFATPAAPGGGLANLEERVRALDGDLVIHSTPGGGTTVEARLVLDRVVGAP